MEFRWRGEVGPGESTHKPCTSDGGRPAEVEGLVVMSAGMKVERAAGERRVGSSFRGGDRSQRPAGGQD